MDDDNSYKPNKDDAKSSPESYAMKPTVSIQTGEVRDLAKIVDPAATVARQEPIEFTAEEGRRVLRKIDCWLLPMLMWVYMIQFADKTSLNYASVMGIRDDIHLSNSSQEYSWISSIFYAGYIVWQFPTTYLLRRLPLGKYSASMIFLWGVVLTCHAAAFNYAGMLALRFFLGALEATVTPAFVLFISIWYKREEQAKRMNAWLCCNGVATLIMSPFAYGLSGATNTAIETWRILFLVLGLLTVCTGLVLWIVMPDNQAAARFLKPRESLVAIERIRGNFQGIMGNRVWNWNQFFEAFRDPRTYLYVLFSLLMNIPNGGITTFGSLIIKSFGFDNRLALLLQMPGGFVDIVCKLGFGFLSDKLVDRSIPAICAILIPMVGGIMMITIPSSAAPALLVGYYLISCAGASWGLVMVMISNNTVGYTKKLTVNGLQILAYGAGNWIGPQTFRSADAPEYFHGKLMVAIMYGAAAVVLLLIRLINIWENRRRDKAQAREPDAAPEAADGAFLDLTDREQKDFRYIL
ncbi:MFS general substrate transporter [Lecanosticta acicola]|uniref:MFS general substrate transporter n=1 Tax=Lecanosticta acicola TaxID=111012 RepID=A0AAI8Z746_9PEZI|nr:MFS general substrate transporter [Lecanosticta acicola]